MRSAPDHASKSVIHLSINDLFNGGPRATVESAGAKDAAQVSPDALVTAEGILLFQSVLSHYVHTGVKQEPPMRAIRLRLWKYLRGSREDAFGYAMIAAALILLSFGILAACQIAGLLAGSIMLSAALFA